MTAKRDKFGRPIVVVTGMGVVTSLGAGKSDNWAKLSAGESGIRTITRFPTDGLKTTMAGTVDFFQSSPSHRPSFPSVWPTLLLKKPSHRPTSAQRRLPWSVVSGCCPGRTRMAAPPGHWPCHWIEIRHRLRRTAARQRWRQVHGSASPLRIRFSR